MQAGDDTKHYETAEFVCSRNFGFAISLYTSLATLGRLIQLLLVLPNLNSISSLTA
jgi:hypothetical protein